MRNEIVYIVPHREAETYPYSLFQGYSHGLIKTHSLLDYVLTHLPPSLNELCIDKHSSISSRKSGLSPFNITPLNLEALEGAIELMAVNFSFVCVVSLEEYESDVRNILKKILYPVFHICQNPEHPLESSFEETCRSSVWNYTREVFKFAKNKSPNGGFDQLEKMFNGYVEWDMETLEDCHAKTHNITLPNYRTLRSFEIEPETLEPLFSKNQKDYLDASISSLTALKHITDQVKYYEFRPNNIGLIFNLPALYRHMYTDRLSKIFGQEIKAIDMNAFKKCYKAISKQKGFNFAIELDDENLPDNKIFHALAKERAGEFHTFTCGISVQSISSACPALRLPMDLNLLKEESFKLGHCVRSSIENISNKTPPSRRLSKLNELTKRLASTLSDRFPEEYKELLPEHAVNIKLVTDTPLELMPTKNGLPFGVRHNVCRIPATPGNVSFSTCLNTSNIDLHLDHFSEILVIRSFIDNDPIKDYLEIAISNFTKGRKPSKVNFTDVVEEADLITALNEFQGAIVIFDCHGSHDETDNIGGIILKGKHYDIWKLRNKVRVPPIVILSACDTHPLDRSHASTANGFLMLGARSVLATTLPVNAYKASLFIARLIYRVEEFVPIVLEHSDKPLTWLQVVSGMLKMNYISEILDTLSARLKMSEEDSIKYILAPECNILINSGQIDWFEKSVQLIAEHLNIETSEVYEFIDMECQYLDIMKYIQLGNPDKIHIYSDALSSKLKNTLSPNGV